MLARTWFSFLTILLVLVAPEAFGQKGTEMFIPIGKSPGLSGKYTSIGKISSVNMQDQAMTMTDADGASYTVTCTEKTIIWLDRSTLRLTNQRGSLTDCKKDLVVEVKYVNNDRQNGGVAEWIKVQIVN